MNVGQLKELLEQHPDDLEMICFEYSDYVILEASGLEIVEAVEQTGGWVMRAHPTMSAENKAKAKNYLCIG